MKNLLIFAIPNSEDVFFKVRLQSKKKTGSLGVFFFYPTRRAFCLLIGVVQKSRAVYFELSNQDNMSNKKQLITRWEFSSKPSERPTRS